MKIIKIFFLSLFLVSCHKSENHSIEIYLLKDRVTTDEGISIDKAISIEDVDTTLLKDIPIAVRYDTVNKEFIYAGSFRVKENQIEPTPLIKNEEILGLSIENSEIKLAAEAANKIIALKPSMKGGIQFVITDI